MPIAADERGDAAAVQIENRRPAVFDLRRHGAENAGAGRHADDRLAGDISSVSSQWQASQLKKPPPLAADRTDSAASPRRATSLVANVISTLMSLPKRLAQPSA